MATSLINFNKNPNIGLFGFVTDKFALVGKEVNETAVEEIERILKVPVHTLNIAGTSLVGVFVAGNSEKIVVPHIIFDSEKKILDDLGIKYEVMKTNMTCLGNNIVMNENCALVNPDFEDVIVEKIKSIFGVDAKKMSIADTETPGSCIIIRKDKALLHRDASIEEAELIEGLLKVETIHSTINMGSPYLKSGILCNKNGLMIGDISGPAEVMNAEEELGYLDNEKE